VRREEAASCDVVVKFAWTDQLQDPNVSRRAEAVLGETERARAARIRDVAAKRDYVAAHVIARDLLADLSGASPSALAFRSSSGGRPEVAAPVGASWLRFSISHADRLALCAVSAAGDVGADVESLSEP